MVKIARQTSALLQRRTLLFALLLAAAALVLWNQSDTAIGDQSTLSLATTADCKKEGSLADKTEIVEYDTSQECQSLPRIHPSGVFFLNNKKIHQVKSLDEMAESGLPMFFFGTAFADANRIAYHAGDDIPYFALVQESLSYLKQNSDGGGQKLVAIDVGANQGFYTWFLATLGFDEVHAFEIQPENFDALQHGSVFNPKEVADRSRLYPMGLSSTTGRVGQSKGGSYDSHITASEDGSILAVTMDCWAQHVQPSLPIGFAKIDAEGFEIAVLQGGKNSVLQRGSVQTFLVEVAPIRWNRAGVSTETGIQEMQQLSSLFDYGMLLLRGDKECPYNLASELKDKSPRDLKRKVKMFALAKNELEAVLKVMNDRRSSCNFWFSNHDPKTVQG